MTQKFRHAADLRDILGVTRPILLDALDGACHRAYGSTPNMTYGTSSELSSGDYVVLDDTLFAQPIYQPAQYFVVLMLAKTQIIGILRPIFASLDAETLQNLNAKVAIEGLSPREAARQFLVENEFITGE